MKKYYFIILTGAILSNQIAQASCQSQASIAHHEFYVCTQYDQTDKCFFDYVVANKPANKCQEWQTVCLKTSEAADMDSALCE